MYGVQATASFGVMQLSRRNLRWASNCKACCASARKNVIVFFFVFKIISAIVPNIVLKCIHLIIAVVGSFTINMVTPINPCIVATVRICMGNGTLSPQLCLRLTLKLILARLFIVLILFGTMHHGERFPNRCGSTNPASRSKANHGAQLNHALWKMRIQNRGAELNQVARRKTKPRCVSALRRFQIAVRALTVLCNKNQKESAHLLYAAGEHASISRANLTHAAWWKNMASQQCLRSVR